MNKYGERLCSLNIERIIYYLSQGIILDKPVAQLLGNWKHFNIFENNVSAFTCIFIAMQYL